MSPSARRMLEERYGALVRDELPGAGRSGGWVLRADHCFGRVLLDHAVGGCWYDALDRRQVAFRQLDDAQLLAAVALGERVLEEGDALLRVLNRQSLSWRGKVVHSGGSRAATMGLPRSRPGKKQASS